MNRLIATALLLLAGPASALDWQDHPGIDELFSDAGLRGTFVLYDVAAGRLVGHDRARAETRHVPASTFKIPNTLIGLTAGAVKDIDEVLPFGGKPQWVKAWERNMALREAIKVSSVPVYQELARRVGRARMRDGVARLEYGNGELGTVVDRFWLDGPLRISAVEQARFLARLARGQLPFPAEVQATVRELVRLEQGDGWALYGKTGWFHPATPDIGWWVGWVTRGDRVYAFALNIDLLRDADAPRRIELGKACLRALGVL